MLLYDDLEDDVVTRLAPLAATYRVEVLPDRDNTDRNDKQRITVFAQGATYKPAEGLGFVTQSGEVRLMVEIDAKKRRGEGSIRAIADAVTTLLLGYRFDNFEKLELIEDSTVKQEDGMWFTQLIFRARRTVTEVPDELVESTLEHILVNVPTSVEQIEVGEAPEP